MLRLPRRWREFLLSQRGGRVCVFISVPSAPRMRCALRPRFRQFPNTKRTKWPFLWLVLRTNELIRDEFSFPSWYLQRTGMFFFFEFVLSGVRVGKSKPNS